MSPCGSDHIFTSIARGGWRLASEDSRSRLLSWPFLLIVRTGRIVTEISISVVPDSRGSQHMASSNPQDHSCGGQARGTSRASTLGPFVDCYSRQGCRGRGHFCRALRVATKTGLSHHDSENRVWRIVSEDSWTAAPRPFLLISRTARIVTATVSVASSDGYSGFPAYSQI